MAREWKERKGRDRLFGLAGWSALFGFRGLAAPGSIEQRYLRWSRARAVVEAGLLATIPSVIGESLYWTAVRGLPLEALKERWAYLLGKELPLPALVEVPAGTFMMGSERDEVSKPVRRVAFAAPFHLGRTEVTFAEWDACVADGGCNGYRPALGREVLGTDDPTAPIEVPALCARRMKYMPAKVAWISPRHLLGALNQIFSHTLNS